MKVGDIVKFGDMPYGTHFQEVNGKRKFIKIQNILPSGLRQKHVRLIEGKDAKPMSFDTNGLLVFNAIDYEGDTASCPEWLNFKVTKVSKYNKYFVNGSPVRGE